MISNPPYNFGDFSIWERRIDASRDPSGWKIVVIDGPVPVPLDSSGNKIPGSGNPIRNVQAVVYHAGHGIIVKVFSMGNIENRTGELEKFVAENYPDIPWTHQNDLDKSDGTAFVAAVRRVASREVKGILPVFAQWISLPVKEKAHV